MPELPTRLGLRETQDLDPDQSQLLGRTARPADAIALIWVMRSPPDLR
jgi:hypothetical protein